MGSVGSVLVYCERCQLEFWGFIQELSGRNWVVETAYPLNVHIGFTPMDCWE